MTALFLFVLLAVGLPMKVFKEKKARERHLHIQRYGYIDYAQKHGTTKEKFEIYSHDDTIKKHLLYQDEYKNREKKIVVALLSTFFFNSFGLLYVSKMAFFINLAVWFLYAQFIYIDLSIYTTCMMAHYMVIMVLSVILTEKYNKEMEEELREEIYA